VRLEPSCAPAWIELALLRLEEGQLGAARQALARVEAAVAGGRGLSLEGRYERALVQVDRAALARLRVRCGVSR
jgi:hypothetical protein